MIKLTSEAHKVCVAKAQEAGQAHIFEGWEDLTPEAQRVLIEQVQKVDFQLLRRLVHDYLQNQGPEADPIQAPFERRLIAPVVPSQLPCPQREKEDFELCRTLGEFALRNRQVLVVTAAGGKADAPGEPPLGLLPVGPVTGKSLFQLFAEKILAVGRRYRTAIRWTIVCHPAEREQVTQFFRANSNFGLASSDVSISDQEMLPIVDLRGKILLSGPGQMAMAPNGHGGVLLRLLDEGRIEGLESAGILHIFYFQLDNPLVNVCDPVFLGHHIKNQCDVSSKVVRKAAPDERVGVFCNRDGALSVVEHCELSPEDRSSVEANGGLAFWAANTGTHLLSLDFLRRLRAEGVELPFHSVPQVTSCKSSRSRAACPSKPNSLRFVTYAFDVLPFAARASVIEVSRAEFSPIKRRTGNCDSLETARRDLSKLYREWLDGAMPGALASLGKAGAAVEICPTYALGPEDLLEKAVEKSGERAGDASPDRASAGTSDRPGARPDLQIRETPHGLIVGGRGE